MRTTSVVRAVAVGAAMAVLAACGTGSETSSDSTSGSSGSSGPVTISWWHNSNTDPGKAYYDTVAKEFEASHPGVKIEVSAMQHEDMLTKLDAAFQSGDAPDVYMERGGGELADHVEAGLTKDISEPAKDVISTIGGSVAGWQVDGKTYALPFSVGVVGFWYNKSLFEKAGITAPPATMDEFFAAVDKLKAAGIAPVSVGAGDKWPAAHYWYYTALRECPQQVLQDAVKSLDFSDPCFVKAGEDVQKIIAAKPVQQGLPVHPRPDRADERLRAARHRQGRDGDAGALGARCHAGPDRRQEGPGREHRLVRLPDRRRWTGRPERGPRWR